MSNNGAGTQNGRETTFDYKKQGTADATTARSDESANSCPIAAACGSVLWFVKDYIGRHAHPVNASLHILGVPAAFAGFFYFFTGKDVPKGAALIVLGYLFQYLGHKAQGNEVGEVTLMKNIYRKLKHRS
ncbi:DUF962 domain-containing protein [Candidatus Obscuribacterales bacterium]|nr:DUF962 domain-containing protein [Candidatus Obscuribacterales bacterium]MBX3153947.1 DUF962 domain-containing protein [Candidatus Obscuribacterales bacterium]